MFHPGMGMFQSEVTGSGKKKGSYSCENGMGRLLEDVGLGYTILFLGLWESRILH